MASAGSADDVKGLEVAPIVEFVARISPTSHFLLTVVGFSQPAGGNDDVEVTWYPIPMLAAGMEWHL